MKSRLALVVEILAAAVSAAQAIAFSIQRDAAFALIFAAISASFGLDAIRRIRRRSNTGG